MFEKLTAVAVASLVLVGTALPAAAAPLQGFLTTEQWRADLDVVADGIMKTHRNGFHRTSRADLERAITDLRDRIPELADHEVIVGMARIVAMVGDGHTRLTFHHDPTGHAELSHSPPPAPQVPQLAFHHLPVRLEWFDDGLFVRPSTEAHRDLLGTQVLRFGHVEADSAIARVRPLVACDNESGRKLYVPSLLSVPEVLHALALASDPLGATLTVRDGRGRTREVLLAAIPGYPPAPFVDGVSLATAEPLWLRDSRRAFWFEYLESSGTLFVQLNQIGADGDVTLSEFSARLDSMIAARRPRRLVLDLRHNSGGDNSLNRALFLTLVRRDEVNRHGRLFAIIGRKTFSAAQNLVNDLEHFAEVLFVGEPTGASPSNYGDSRRITLPHSGLVLRVATVYWRDWTGDESRPWTAPDLPAAMKAADYFSGRDPALEAAIAFQPAATVAERVEQIGRTGGRTSSVRLIYRTITDPKASAADRAAALEAYGRLAKGSE